VRKSCPHENDANDQRQMRKFVTVEQVGRPNNPHESKQKKWLQLIELGKN